MVLGGTLPSLPQIDDQSVDLNLPFSLTFDAADGGDGAITYSVDGNPSWLSLTDRTLTGTPTSTGSHTISITATDADNDTDTVRFVLTVAPGTNAPGAPTAPTLTAPTTRSLRIALSADPASAQPITSRDIRYKATSTGAWTTLQDITSPQTITAGIVHSTEYEAQWRANSSLGEGNWSPSATVTTPAATPPAAPDPPTLTTLSTSSIRADWTAPDGGAAAITSYTLDFRRQNEGATPPLLIAKRPHLHLHRPRSRRHLRIQSASPQRRRRQRVHQLDRADHHPQPTPTPPDPPTVLALRADRIRISWTAPANNGGGAITRYDVRTRETGGSWNTLNNIASPYDLVVIAGLTWETQVRAHNAGGTGPWSTSTSTPLPATNQAPDAPADAPTLQVLGENSIRATFIEPDSNGILLTQQDIRIRATGTAAWTTQTNVASPYTFTALTHTTEYEVQTRGINFGGAGAWSTSRTATTTAPNLTPTAPAIPNQSATANSHFSYPLPLATGGNPPITTTANQLPPGLTLTNGEITGTPTTPGTTAVTVTYTDADGDTAHRTFNITIITDLSPTAGATPNQAFIGGSTHTFQIAQGSGGNPPLTTAVAGNPANTSFDPQTNTLTVGPATAIGNYTITVTYTDADGDSATDTFNLAIQTDIDPVPGFTPDATFIAGDEHTLTIAAATAGNTPITTSISGNPPNTVYSAATRTLAISANAAPGSYTITVTYTDVDNDTATADFTLTITPDAHPVAGNTPDQAFINDRTPHSNHRHRRRRQRPSHHINHRPTQRRRVRPQHPHPHSADNHKPRRLHCHRHLHRH